MCYIIDGGLSLKKKSKTTESALHIVSEPTYIYIATYIVCY